MTLTERYKVVDDSLSKHCCFGYTVVDTQYVDREDEIICECFEEGAALMIANTLSTEWQPIETAPSSRVLMYRDDSKSVDIGWASPEYFGNPFYAYTHWMPIPKAPEIKGT